MSHFMVYLKPEQSVCINNRKARLSDVATVYCSDPEVTQNVKNILLVTFPNEKSSRSAVSILKII